MKPQNSRREREDFFISYFLLFKKIGDRVLIETLFELISHWQSFLKLHGKVSF